MFALRTLLVDDEPLAIDRLQVICAKLPQVEVVGTANDGEAGLSLIEALKPDLLLLDMTMPGMDGLALARAIDGVPEWKTDRDGGLITYGVKHNEALVMFFLRNRRPERYSEHIRPGLPVYERIRREVEAGLPPTLAEDREAACEGETDSRECALSRHFADRLAQVGPDGTAVVAGDGEAPAQLFLDKAGTKADLVRSRGRGANSRSRDSRQGETK